MRAIAFLMMVFLSAAMPALEIYVAPVLYVDETGENVRDTGRRVQAELLAELRSVETGVALQFGRLRDNVVNPPVSLFDAVTVCRDEHVEYLLYGYVGRRVYNLTAEVRLFEYSSRTVVQTFYGTDDLEHHDRLIRDIASKILQYVRETFKLDIVPERVEMTQLSVPVAVGYWTSMDGDWIRVMLGTVTVGTGLDFTPTDNIWIIRGMPWYLSVGLEVKYRLGVGNPERYESYNHTVYLTMPVRLHIVFERRHEIFAGLGFTYFLEFFSIADKYADLQTYVYNNMGLSTGFGYRFAAGRTLSVFFRNDFDFLFNEHPLITYSPTIGLDIRVYEKQIQRKW
jgi:hypothetical protein